MTRPDPALRPGSKVTRSPRDRALDRLRKGLGSLRSRAGELEHRIRHRATPGGTASVARRPDGTLVSPGVEPVRISPPAGRIGVVAQVSAPLLSMRDSFRDHWNDSIREARLAAREKETEMRADYERRVAHDPHLHAEQHHRDQDGGRH